MHPWHQQFAVAVQQPLLIMDRIVPGQASVLALSRIYWISGVVLLCATPSMQFWHSGRPRGMPVRDGH